MEFTPTKCYYTTFTNRQCHIVYIVIVFIILSLRRIFNSTMKYLGFNYIDNKLTWRNHVDFIVSKANSIKGFSAHISIA